MTTLAPRRSFAFLVSLSLLGLVPAEAAVAERNLLQTVDGITVEEQSEPGRILPILFGTTTMSAPPGQIAAWIGAVHTYTEWQHNCEEARPLPQPDGTVLNYNRVGSPWPVSDRDVLLRSQRTNHDDGSIRIEFRNIDAANAANAPESTGAVRMPRLIGSYDLVPIDDGTRVVYTLDSDPGGSLPTWLIRQASKDLPFNTLKNLRERAESGPPPQP